MSCEKVTGKKPDPPKPKEDKPKEGMSDASDKYDKYDKYASKSSDEVCKAKDLTCADHYSRYDVVKKGEESSKDGDSIGSTSKPKKSFPYYKKEPLRIMKFDEEEKIKELKEKGKLIPEEVKSKDIYGSEDLDWEPTHYYDEKDYKYRPKKSKKHKLMDMLKELEFKEDKIDLDDAAPSKKKTKGKKKKDKKEDDDDEKKEKEDDKKLGPLAKELKKLKLNVTSVKKLV